MAYWPGESAVLKVQVPALVTRLPAVPPIRIEPSDEMGDGNGLDEWVQPDPPHSHQEPSLLLANMLPCWATSSSWVGVAPTCCPFSRMAYWPGESAVLNVQVPALVTRLPAVPA